MTANEESIRALREALKISPDNAPLRIHLADLLNASAQYDEAEREFATALTLSPGNETAKVGLAYSCYQLGKYSQALVIVEDLVKQAKPPAKALIIHSRLLLNDGEVEKARQAYARGTEIDPSVKDSGLHERLGLTEKPIVNSSDHDRSAVTFDGRLKNFVTNEDADDHSTFVDIEKSDINFANVGGMDDVKEQVRMKIIYPLENQEMFKQYGKKVGGGILMYGPPGCGKTFLARATAGEIKANFMSVGINDVLDMFIGESERHLHEIFESARRNTPCVVFFDEVDALAASRHDSRKSGTRQTINQFLQELDGVDTSNEGVLILAATNAPWHLDSAFRRPGRFDRIIFVPPPDQKARADILRLTLKGKPVENIDYDFLAKKTDKFSGADLFSVVDHAVEAKLSQAMKDGVPKPISTKDLENAVKNVKPSTAEWFATARNYALYSNQGGTYDDIVKYMKL
ncbi:MAG: ATP-binding protein [Candidatus Obscuribacterales bacterium]|nr:ATP-binding protein [Candidatus Obscuribacterales bacterium]